MSEVSASTTTFSLTSGNISLYQPILGEMQVVIISKLPNWSYLFGHLIGLCGTAADVIESLPQE